MKKLIVALFIMCFVILPGWCEKYSNDYFELDVPEGLEIQNETWSALNNLVRVGSSESDDVVCQLVLQQSGLNALQDDSWNNYCRVMITIVDYGVEGYSNKNFENEMTSYTSKELQDIYDNLEYALVGQYEVLERYERNTKYIDGKYALHLSLLRESAIEDRGAVFVDSCYFVVNGYMFCVTKSYRYEQKSYYAPLVDKAVASLKIIIEDRDESVLYEQRLPWLYSSFLWPEKTIDWETTTSSDGTKKRIYFSNVYDLGFTYELMVLYFNTALSKSDQNEVLKQFKNQAVLGLKSKMKNYNISVMRDRVVNGVVYIDYTYSFSGNKVYGTMYSRFADSKRFISTVAESLNANDSVVTDINESLGF